MSVPGRKRRGGQLRPGQALRQGDPAASRPDLQRQPWQTRWAVTRSPRGQSTTCGAAGGPRGADHLRLRGRSRAVADIPARRPAGLRGRPGPPDAVSG
ncbi:hypothetical protein LV779_16235 [Streptomyces thinghirensis]|nr:hypothetical protein [Streptomyces thinghirensis]